MTKQTQKLVLMLGVGILIGTMFVMVMKQPLAKNTEEVTLDASLLADDILVTPNATIRQAKQFPLPPSVPENTRIGLSVANQQARNIVYVSGLSVSTTSWVAIYDAREGKPGSILGAQKVNIGNASVEVELLRAEGTLAGSTYFAALLPDDGDGQFNRLSDLPPFSPEKVVIVSWKAL